MMALSLDTAFGPSVLFRGTMKVGHGRWNTKTCLWQSNWLVPLPTHNVLLEQLTISMVSSRMPLSLVFSLPLQTLLGSENKATSFSCSEASKSLHFAWSNSVSAAVLLAHEPAVGTIPMDTPEVQRLP